MGKKAVTVSISLQYRIIVEDIEDEIESDSQAINLAIERLRSEINGISSVDIMVAVESDKTHPFGTFDTDNNE